MSSTPVCVDASLVVKLLVPEARSDLAERLWQGWLEQGVQILAPALLAFEVPSVLRKQVQRGLISEERGREALQAFEALSANVELISAQGLHARAWKLAVENRQPNLYDAYYVALAELAECRLWTADDRLRRAMPGAAGSIAAWADEA